MILSGEMRTNKASAKVNSRGSFSFSSLHIFRPHKNLTWHDNGGPSVLPYDKEGASVIGDEVVVVGFIVSDVQRNWQQRLK